MENWACISHGTGQFIIDRLIDNSDGYETYVCNYCGLIVVANIKNNKYECRKCQQNTAISKIRIPYAFKLLLQELQALGMGIWFNVDEEVDLIPSLVPIH